MAQSPPRNSLRWASVFGGPKTHVGVNVDEKSAISLTNSLSSRPEDVERLRSSHSNGSNNPKAPAKNHRTCNWLQTAALIMAEFIGFAILGFPNAYAKLGWAWGVVATLFIGACYLYTSLVLWEFCLRHPEARNICDIGRILFGRHGKFGFWFTVAMFVGNNVWVQGVHVSLGGEFFTDVLTGRVSSICPAILGGVITTLFCLLCSLPPSMRYLSFLACPAVVCTFVCVIMAMVFISAQDGPVVVSPDMETAVRASKIIVSPWPAPGTTLRDIMIALLGIAFAFIGQLTLPSFIAEMRDPRDFPKALFLSSAVQYAVFIMFAIFMYNFIGNDHMKPIALEALKHEQRIIAFGLLMPSLIILGSLYGTVTARFLIDRFCPCTSEELAKNKQRGWTVWVCILAFLWLIAFVVSQTIPGFEALLAIVGSLFDGFFGYIYWGFAWFRMRRADQRAGPPRVWGRKMTCVNVLINGMLILVGVVVFLGLGSWASFSYIVEEFAKNPAKKPFGCAS